MAIKSLDRVIKENGQYEKMIREVVDRVGMDSIEDINNHGIDGGFGGFIYYSDTLEFFRQFRLDILNLLDQTAFGLGEGMFAMIKSFPCIQSGEYSELEISDAIYNDDGENTTQIQNCLAWVAAEEVCRMFER